MRIQIQLKILMPIRIQIRGGGGRSAKNVHPPWQNPRYAPEYSALKYRQDLEIRFCSKFHTLTLTHQYFFRVIHSLTCLYFINFFIAILMIQF
jgi:hypothetical protein